MSEANWRAFCEAEPDAVLIVERNGVVRDLNEAGVRLFEADRTESAIGKPIEPRLAPEDRDRFRAFADRVCGGHKGSLEIGFTGLKGTTRTLALHAAPLDGASLLLVTRDITDLRENEDNLRESQKMAAVGELAGGFAHDFNNLLNGIMGSLWLVATKLGPDHPAAPIVASAGQAGRRAAEILRQLLSIGRRSKTALEPVNLHPILEEVIKRVSRTYDPRIEVVLHEQADVWPVQADPVQMRQVLMNVCANAGEAMPEGGRLTIDVGNVSKKSDEGLTEEIVRIMVSDTGKGIEAATLPRIFEPFFTTKAEGKGLGLGLTVSQAIVTRFGGTVKVESEAGRGTKVIMEIPRRAEVEVAAAPAPVEQPSAKGHGEVVMVVDDEEILRVVARAALEQAGYKVLEAEDATSAMQLYRSERERIAVVVSDVKMPDRSGLDVLADLRTVNPDVRVILCSGSVDVDKKNEMLKLGAKAFLPKPYSAMELTRLVHQVIEPVPQR